MQRLCRRYDSGVRASTARRGVVAASINMLQAATPTYFMNEEGSYPLHAHPAHAHQHHLLLHDHHAILTPMHHQSIPNARQKWLQQRLHDKA